MKNLSRTSNDTLQRADNHMVRDAANCILYGGVYDPPYAWWRHGLVQRRVKLGPPLDLEMFDACFKFFLLLLYFLLIQLVEKSDTC